MDEVAACRHAARDAVRDIEPEQLRAVMDDLLVEASMTPGVVTVRAARAASAADGDSGAAVIVERYDDPPGVSARDGRREKGLGVLPDHAAERAAGVQLIYEGLRLIRRLAAEDPWTVTEETTPTDENMAVLAADVLVSRGFYLLARTPAADKAVETVRNFGHDQTIAREVDSRNRDHDRNLEADVLRLALIAGTAATPGVTPTSGALSAAADLGRSSDRPLPPARTALAGVGVRATGGAEVGHETEPTRPATDP